VDPSFHVAVKPYRCGVCVTAHETLRHGRKSRLGAARTNPGPGRCGWSGVGVKHGHVRRASSASRHHVVASTLPLLAGRRTNPASAPREALLCPHMTMTRMMITIAQSMRQAEAHCFMGNLRAICHLAPHHRCAVEAAELCRAAGGCARSGAAAHGACHACRRATTAARRIC
jgi:hypothetical protein